MIKNVSILALLLLGQVLAQPGGSDFSSFSKWLKEASTEEKTEYFHSLSDNYTEQHGKKANDMRLCMNVYNNWSGMNTWIDQKYGEAGVRILDDQRYNDFVANARPGDKPWVIMFAYLPTSGPTWPQPMDNGMKNMGCMA